MLAEMFRISSHLVFYGTFVQDLGQMSPVFYMFADRERLFGIIEAITGGTHASGLVPYRRRGTGPANGWDKMVREFIDSMPARLDQYDKMAMQNSMIKRRTRGIGQYSARGSHRMGRHRTQPAGHRAWTGTWQKKTALRGLRPV